MVADATLTAEPDDAQGRVDEALRVATALHRDGNAAEAVRRLHVALAEDPQAAALHNALGVMCAALGRLDDAIGHYQRALALAPATAPIWSNLGNALTLLKHHKTAVLCHRRALVLVPEDAGTAYNLGISLAADDQHADAVAAFTQALARDPAHRMARWDRGRSRLTLGDFPAGWADYDSRLENGMVKPRVALPRWQGQPYPGQTLLILAEQGYGDAIWAARYFARAKALGGRLVVECPAELAPLFAGLGSIDLLVVRGAELPPADLVCAQCSLPGLFTRNIGDIPGAAYLAAPVRGGKALPPPANETALRVGVVWSGSPSFARNADRAQNFAAFRRAFSLPGIQLYSLQMGPAAAQFQDDTAIIDLSGLIGDFADTAALVGQLDLIIMTDSAVAHLAGAMGKPVWLLLGDAPHWLWQRDAATTPWYPGMRIFRTRGPLDWPQVFDQAAAALWALQTERASLRQLHTQSLFPLRPNPAPVAPSLLELQVI